MQTADPLARAAALYGLGFAEDAAGAAIEGTLSSVADRALVARTLLAVGQNEQACVRADVDSLPEDAAPEPTFALLEVLAFCQLDQGAAEASQLIVELLKEQGGGDSLFFALAGGAGAGGALPGAADVGRVRPIHVALMRRAGVPFPADYVAYADTALLGLISRSESADQATLIATAERAVESGLLDVGSLVSRYGTTSLDQTLLMQASTGAAPPGPLARAHLFALVAEAQSPADRVRFIATLYEQGRLAGVGGAVAEAIGEDAAGVTPDPSLGIAAPLMVEILARADRVRAALGWIDAGEFPGADGRAALSSFDAHRNRALIAVLDPQIGVAAGALGADAGGGALSATERAFVETEVAVMTALGDAVSPVLYDIAGRPPPQPPAQSAAAVLEALAPLSGLGLGHADPSAVARAIGALASFGLVNEARFVATDALAARGIGQDG